MTDFLLADFAVAVVAGAIASVSGFGIGSLMTPLMAMQMELKLAVALVSIPHFAATALRCWLLRRHVSVDVFRSFGLASAVGGLAGAVFHNSATNPVLLYLFAALLIIAGLSAMTGLSAKLRLPRSCLWVAGVLSGGFGGLVGNQGGIRSAALLSCELEKDAFVATATATGLVVDLVRMPVYFYWDWPQLSHVSLLIIVATVGALIGTICGKSVLKRIPEGIYRVAVGAVILLLGLWQLLQALGFLFLQ